jgi:hypothetical protein
MNRCRACSPWSSRTCSSCSVASAKPAPDIRTSRASRPASIARCSSTTSARVSRDRMRTSTMGSVMPDTVRQALPIATPSSSKSVDKCPCSGTRSYASPAVRLRAFGGKKRLPRPNASFFRTSGGRRRTPPSRSQSSAPMLRVCSAFRRASSTTSSENIWLYLCCSSTGFVRCSLDFSAAIVRITLSSWSAADVAIT